ERNQREGRDHHDRQQRESGCRGREYAEHAGSDKAVPGSEDSLWSGESRQRRWRGDLWIGDVAEQPAHVVDPRRSGRQTAQDHDRDSQELLRHGQGIRHARQPGEWRQHWWLPEGRQLDAGSGTCVRTKFKWTKYEVISYKRLDEPFGVDAFHPVFIKFSFCEAFAECHVERSEARSR